MMYVVVDVDVVVDVVNVVVVDDVCCCCCCFNCKCPRVDGVVVVVVQ